MKINFEAQGALGANCYTFSSERTAVVIDPFAQTTFLKSFLNENKAKDLYIVATHRHFDHVAAIADIKRDFGGQILVSPSDACGLLSTVDSLGEMAGVTHATAAPDILLREGEQTIGDISIRVINTPGHTSGSVCLIVEDVLFSGDTLFYKSIGRTDFPTGNMTDMQRSLARLFSLDKDYTVYPGHGEATSLYYERDNNPYYFRGF